MNFRSGQQYSEHLTMAASTAESAEFAKEIVKSLSELGVLRGEMHWLTVQHFVDHYKTNEFLRKFKPISKMNVVAYTHHRGYPAILIE